MSDAPPVDSATATSDLKSALTGIALVLFGVQTTLTGLVGGSSALAIAAGFAVSFGGLFRTLTA